MADVGGRAVLGAVDRLFRLGSASGWSDGQLLERFATRHDEGAEAAFATLVERHGPMVLRVCRRVLNDPHDAQDAFQATFLVLMKKAASVRRRESVSCWLYGVARRVASHARAASARRRQMEQGAARPETAEAESHAPDRELWDEVDRLPEAHRTAVVLCYLEGLTHEQAALRLGWPVGTVRSRLARARDKLRGRLTRRGLAPGGLDPSVGLLAMLRVSNPLLVTPKLIESTARAALMLAVGDAVETGLVSARAALLTQGVLRTMLLTKLKAAAGVVATAGIFATGVGVYARQSPSADATPAIARFDDYAPTPKPERPRLTPDAVRSKDPGTLIVDLVAKVRAARDDGQYDVARQSVGQIAELAERWEQILTRTGTPSPDARPTRTPRGARAQSRRSSDSPVAAEPVIAPERSQPPQPPRPPTLPPPALAPAAPGGVPAEPPRPPTPPSPAVAPAAPAGVPPAALAAPSSDMAPPARPSRPRPPEPAARSARLPRMPEPARAEDAPRSRRASPDAPPGPAPRDSERRLDDLERKLDRILRALEGGGRLTPGVRDETEADEPPSVDLPPGELPPTGQDDLRVSVGTRLPLLPPVGAGPAGSGLPTPQPGPPSTGDARRP